MITRITIKNFKGLKDIDIEVGDTVVLIGPNNSGKSSALQAVALWAEGLKKWNEKRAGKSTPEKRPGVTINRRDLISIPVPTTNHLWRDLKTATALDNVFIDIIVEGVTNGKTWKCGMEFYYANEESIYCRPLRIEDTEYRGQYPVPEEAYAVSVAFLSPMSGLAASEALLQPGKINVFIGEGQTAHVLRNLCYQIYDNSISEGKEDWNIVVENIRELFGVELLPPDYNAARGEIRMSYKNEKKTTLDISSSGRGLQQTLLLLSHLYSHKGSVLLLDEPDAHLEVLRQRQIYETMTHAAARQNSQIIAASHSEVILNEAANRDTVIAFVGKPHRIDNRAQARKALLEIGFDQYYQAEQKGWAIYLEGSTDLAILRVFARTLGHEAYKLLERPFIKYVENKPPSARNHFFGLFEAKKDLVGIALFDRIDTELQNNNPALLETMWEKRELENYLCIEEVLLDYARGGNASDLFEAADSEIRVGFMKECIEELVNARKVQRKPSPWSDDVKSSDEFLDPLFENYFEKLNLPNIMRKTNYHKLADLVPKNLIAKEISDKLDIIVEVASKAKPETE